MDVLELFAGGGTLSRACVDAGLKVASGLDILYRSYGRAWDFSRKDHQADAAYLIVFVFKPKILHLGTQCKDYCVLGKNQPSPDSAACTDFSGTCAAHQEQCGLGASLENPWVSKIWMTQPWSGISDGERKDHPGRSSGAPAVSTGCVSPERISKMDGDHSKGNR